MACGFGVCNACAVPLDDGKGGVARYARACMDGPVVDAAQVLWHPAGG
jgi:dihydroorotate dehydrogenase electron transfer subunit